MWLPAFASERPARRAVRLTTLRAPPGPGTSEVRRVGRFECPADLPPAHVAVLEALDCYFDDERLGRVLRAVQQGGDGLSLRILDWLVTNFSKKELMTCSTPDGERRDLHNRYREALDFYGRPLFDAFRRGPRVRFEVDGVADETTVGQLNFFRFMLHAGVLDCALRDARLIERDMIKTHARAKELREALGGRRRRIELTPSDPCRFHVVGRGGPRPPAVQTAAAEPAESAAEPAPAHTPVFATQARARC